MLCHVSSILYAFRTSSLTISVPELKTHRSVSSTNINAASSEVIPDLGVHSYAVTLLVYRHLTKRINTNNYLIQETCYLEEVQNASLE